MLRACHKSTARSTSAGGWIVLSAVLAVVALPTLMIPPLTTVRAQENAAAIASPVRSPLPANTQGDQYGIPKQQHPTSQADAVHQSLVEFLPKPSPAEERIIRALDEPISCDFVDMPLIDALEYFREIHAVQIVIDEMNLLEEGVAIDEPVNLMLHDVRLKSALRLMLKPLGLTFVVEDDVMKVTTEVAAQEMVRSRIYPVGDLCPQPESYEELIEVITAGVDSDRWVDQGGMNSIVPFRSLNCLMIKQTFEGHQAVLQLLRNLRLARATRDDHTKSPAAVNNF